MNKTIKYGLFGLGLFTLSACVDTMDTHPSSSFEEETIWGSKSTVEAFINGIYDEVIRNAGYAGSGSSVQWEARTPNAVKCSQVAKASTEWLPNWESPIPTTTAPTGLVC